MSGPRGQRGLLCNTTQHILCMKKYIFLCAFFLPLLTLGAGMQKIKIDKVLDANLFKAGDGRLLRMAGIQAPSVASADSFFAHKAMVFMRELLAAYPVYYQPEAGRGDTLDVHFLQKYPLTTINLNKRFLQNGYGRYLPNASRAYDGEYIDAQEEARAEGRGLWNAANLKAPPVCPGDNIFLAAYAPARVTDSNADKSSLLDLEWQRYHASTVFNVEVVVTHRVYSGEEGYDERSVLAHVKYGYLGKYFGINGGLAFTLNNGSRLPYFAFPVFALKAGMMKKLYLSANFINIFMRSYASFAVNYMYRYPLGRIALESNLNHDAPAYHMLIQAPVYSKFLLSARFYYDGLSHKVSPFFGLGFHSSF